MENQGLEAIPPKLQRFFSRNPSACVKASTLPQASFRRPPRRRGTALLAGLALSLSATAALPPATVLIVDTEVVLERSSVAQRLRAEAASARAAAAGAEARDQVDAALDLALSELLEALPELIESLATTRGADLVVEPAVASRVGAEGPDLTADVVAALDRQAATVKLELP
jgi:Skp family chaperone for outer membrane proteins